MSNFKIYTCIVLTAVLAGAAYAAPGRGGGGAPHAMGGGGGAHFGGGGAPHFGGGGGAHFGGGGAPHFGGGGGAHFGGGGAPHFGGGAAPHFGGAHIGGAPHFGGARIVAAPHVGGAHIGGGPAISHFAARPSFHGQRSFAVRGGPNQAASRAATLNINHAATLNGSRAAALGQGRNATLNQNQAATARSNAVRNVLNSPSVAGALHNRAALLNPNARAQIVAAAATAGWHGRRGDEHGWWRHRHGGFGWVGPVFWPFAYYDIYDYAIGGYDYDPLFWDYGYNDIYAGLFAPYGYGDFLAYLPPSGGGSRVTVGRAGGASRASTEVSGQLAELCGDDSRDIAGLPIDQIQQAVQPNDAQRAALDELANASIKAAQQIKAACPTQIALTAPGRLAAMQQRIEAMIAAVETVQPALQKFWDLLNDEQRARLNAIAQDQRQNRAEKNNNRSLVESCQSAQASVPQWPEAQIEARLHLNETQRTSLAALKDATAKAADMLKASCPTTEPITPPARLEVIANRLETMLQAVKIVRAALDDFYGKLDDEQKAQFEAIGPARSASSAQPTGSSSQPIASDQPPAARAHVRRHHHAGIPGIIRHLMSMARW
ncbi:LTXXQ motif family protein [Bradyrhizobium lablabi]|uniref:LTXXQ motif family protein n=1 Tax=Bradyrhizobium lablabi TaxID=722472 RepID=A0A1M7AH47_9BRAD|nr:Spy/CpxP family protein refolding chaperone [Bradyrhizobium lablabi]SHL42088.1 LTXXQ motif family protein [Bradyrhizobium lablabi]